MVELNPTDLRDVEKLRREGKFQEALKTINTIEKKGTLTPSDKLSLLISKGKIYTLFQNYMESAKTGELAYQLSRSLGRDADTILSLLFKANILFIGDPNEALEYLIEAEELLNSIKNVSPNFIDIQWANLLFRKSWAYVMKDKNNKALETALECLEIQKKFDRKTDFAYTYQLLSQIYSGLGLDNNEVALDYALKSLKLFEDIGDPIGTATTLAMVGMISYLIGDLNKALTYCKKSLSKRFISDRTKLDNYTYIGNAYRMKGELDRSLRYFKRGISLAEKANQRTHYIDFQIFVGFIYIQKRNYKLAFQYLNPCLALSKNTNNNLGITMSLLGIVLTYYQQDLLEELKGTLNQLKELSEESKSPILLSGYKLGKALVLKKSGRSRDRAEAEDLLKQIIDAPPTPDLYSGALVFLCEFYLEELHLFNEPGIIEEIQPNLEKLLKFAEDQNSYLFLAETKLLQAKIALIKLDINAAKKLLTEAQHIAELHGLNFIAQKISSEHDNLLNQIKAWEMLQESNALMSERLELSAINGVIERLQGVRALEPPEIIEEEPILLMIMDKTGITYFTYSFIENWDFDSLFSSFMSAFNSFSSEIFSESIDRIKIGDNLILISPIESFLVCYIIKGQSYPGLQKLYRFSDAVKNNAEIWQMLNKAVQTGEELNLVNIPSLKSLLNEIFSL